MHAEVLIDKHSHRALGILRSMVDAGPAAGVRVTETEAFQNCGDVLVLWGAGRSDHIRIWRQVLARGGHCVGFDLGYWGRDKVVGCVRIHIDTRHPTAKQLEMTPAGMRVNQRIPDHTFTLRNDYDPAGPIMIVGLGNKSRHMRGEQPEQWERTKYAELKREFPHRAIEWRPKYRMAPFSKPLPLAPDVPIQEGLKGRSLAVCAHSNVALDACLAGIPVRCDDGIAHSLYAQCENPTEQQRLDLLHRSTWWNWHYMEATEIWTFIKRMTSS